MLTYSLKTAATMLDLSLLAFYKEYNSVIYKNVQNLGYGMPHEYMFSYGAYAWTFILRKTRKKNAWVILSLF